MSKTNKKGKKIKWIVLALVILALFGIIASKALKGNQLVLDSVTSGTVKKQDLAKYINITGNVSGKNSTSITGEPSLKVSELNVKIGDKVKKGDVLCVFDSSELQAQFDSLSEESTKQQGAANLSHGINQRNLEKAKRDRANLISDAQQALNDAQAQRDQAYENYNSKIQQYNDLNLEIEQAVAELNSAEDEEAANAAREKWAQLQEQSDALNAELGVEQPQLASYDSAVDAANRAYDKAVAEADDMLQAAQDTVDSEQYTSNTSDTSEELKKLSERIANCTVKAPMDGIITELNISEGNVSATSNIMTISDDSSLIVEGKVDESDILNIINGMEAEITASAIGDEVIKGKVSRIEMSPSAPSMSEGGNSSKGYNVEISFSDKRLLIGMSTNIKIILDEKKDTLSVPYDAVITDEDGSKYVWKAVENGNNYTAKKVDIEIGFEGDYYTEITSGDLKEDDKVLTSVGDISEGSIISLETSEE